MIINEHYNSSDYPIITNHDCFGTLPNNVKNLEIIVKKMFIELYSKENFLEKFYLIQIESIIDNNYLIINKKETKKNILNKLEKIFKEFEIKNKTLQLEECYDLIKNSFKNSKNIILQIDDDYLDNKKFAKLKLIKVINIINIPDVPKYGNLELDKIINSKYIIT